jgi:hypothetical protein
MGNPWTKATARSNRSTAALRSSRSNCSRGSIRSKPCGGSTSGAVQGSNTKGMRREATGVREKVSRRSNRSIAALRSRRYGLRFGLIAKAVSKAVHHTARNNRQPRVRLVLWDRHTSRFSCDSDYCRLLPSNRIRSGAAVHPTTEANNRTSAPINFVDFIEEPYMRPWGRAS